MHKLKKIKRRILVAMVVFLLLGMAAAGYLSTVASTDTREQNYAGMQNDLRLKEREVQPLRGMEGKLKLAEKEIDTFYRERLPDESSEIAAELGSLAARNGVRISQAKYERKPAGLSGLTRVQIDANLEGDYLKAVKFINALERDRLFFILNSVDLGEQQQGGFVRLGLKLETYLREKS
jgi:type IV pilus assembly protein PilO